MPYLDPEQRREKDRRYYAGHRVEILAKKVRPRPVGELPVGVGRRVLAFPDRRQNREGAAALGWALVLHRRRFAR